VPRVSKHRNANTQSEAAFWGSVRSALRRAFRYWKPATQAKMEARRRYEGSNKRQRWEYKCAACRDWHADKNVQIDHIIPVGSLKSGDDLKGFLERLTPEDGFQILCRPCHQTKTNKERGKK